MSRWEPILAGKSRTISKTLGFSFLMGTLLSVLYLWTTEIKPVAIGRFAITSFFSDIAVSPKDRQKAASQLSEARAGVDGYGRVFLHAGLVLIFGTIGAYALIAEGMGRQEKKIAKGEFIAGNCEVSYDEAIEEVAAKLKDPLTAYDYRHTPHDFKVKGYKERKEFRFPRHAGAGHAMYLGASGAGKSKLMYNILTQIRAGGSKAIIMDPGGIYYSRFGRRGDRIYSIYDKRAEYYDFWSEKGFDYFALSSSLIESKGGGKDPFFTESPQSLLAGLLRISEAQGMTELKKHIYSPDIEYLQKALQENTEVSAQFLKDSRLAANVMASYATKLYWLKYLNHWAVEDGRTEPRSISEWSRDDADRSWVFLVAENKDWEASKHFFRMLVTLAGKAVYGRGEYKGRTDIHEIQDEIESIGYNAEFSQKLNIGRKDGYVMHGGLQAVTQFEAIYGEKEANTIIQGFQNKFLFRSEDPRLADRMAENTGKGRWRVRDENVSNEGKASVSMKVEQRTAFRSEDFFALRPGECIAKITGINPFKFALPHKDYPVINQATMSEIPPL
ncbi:MAG: type IV secretion system DNA-binding domain-containing protein [Pseudobdellovibrionaceae bacterium]|nr:type IV secretion system DNA-binding domain-containing protein [Pseudobdellovibrionaceae bacterium]